MVDKIKHFIAGGVIAFLIGIWYPWWGLGVAIAIGAMKEEIYDRILKKGTPDVYDFFATVAGAVIGCIFSFLMRI